MSRWGRAQDALYDLLDGYDNGPYTPGHTPGLLTDKLTSKEIGDLIEPILQTISRVWAVHPGGTTEGDG